MKINSRYISIWDIAIYMLIFLLASVFAGAIFTVVSLITPEPTKTMLMTNTMSIIYPLAFGAFFGFSFFYRHYRTKGLKPKPIRVLHKGKFNLPIIIIGIVVVFGLGIIQEPMYAYYPEQFENYLKLFDGLDTTLAFITVALIAPVLEELIFRGILLNDCAAKWGNRTAILTISLLFGILHFNLIQSVNAFLVGAVIGIIYLKTERGLINVVVLHTINNIIAFVMIKGQTPKDITLTKTMIGNDTLYYCIYGISIIIVIAFLIYGLKKPIKIKE